ncbi:MAG: four helix bundle protein [Elusimicrobia bacterium]|nr:four helix bundle protein [Elusimicrobiota bacterium]
MSKIEKFEDLSAWQEARKLVVLIYKICKKESIKHEYDLISQIKRSAISIMANIAEGFGRYSLKESKQFYTNARGSVTETQSHLYVFKDIHIITQDEFDEIYKQAILVHKLVNGLISNTIRQQDTKTHESNNTKT